MQGDLYRAYYEYRGRQVEITLWSVQITTSGGVAATPAHLRAGRPLPGRVRQNRPADSRVRAACSQEAGAGDEQADARECTEEIGFEEIDWRIRQEI